MLAAPEAIGDVLNVAPEDQARASVYRLCASLLSIPPNSTILSALSEVNGDPATPLGEALSKLRLLSSTDPEAIADEFDALFIGVGRGELLPYASYYLTGFLHEKPLASLRTDMATLGLTRRDGVSEPEDHVSSVLEIMAGLIDGSLAGLSAAQQKAFYRTHVGSWAGHFFADLQTAKAADFYKTVGLVGERFLEIEEQAFLMN